MTDYLAMKPMYYLGNQSDTLFMYRLSQYERVEYYINNILDLPWSTRPSMSFS